MTVYKNTGRTVYKGVQPGQEAELELTADEERRARARGQIKAVKTDNDKPKEEKADA